MDTQGCDTQRKEYHRQETSGTAQLEAKLEAEDVQRRTNENTTAQPPKSCILYTFPYEMRELIFENALENFFQQCADYECKNGIQATYWINENGDCTYESMNSESSTPALETALIPERRLYQEFLQLRIRKSVFTVGTCPLDPPAGILNGTRVLYPSFMLHVSPLVRKSIRRLRFQAPPRIYRYPLSPGSDVEVDPCINLMKQMARSMKSLFATAGQHFSGGHSEEHQPLLRNLMQIMISLALPNYKNSDNFGYGDEELCKYTRDAIESILTKSLTSANSSISSIRLLTKDGQRLRDSDFRRLDEVDAIPYCGHFGYALGLRNMSIATYLQPRLS